jgi:GT2 family glycosyltransferase
MQQNSNKKPIIDLVVTTAGRFDMLKICLDAIYREAQTNPLSIFIIDDFSPAEERLANDELFHYQAEKDPAHNVVNFKVKRHQSVEGFPRSANEGAREGKAPLVMFISDDVELHEGALDKVIRRLDDLTIGIVGIKLIFPPTSTSPIRPPGKVQHVGLALNIRGEPIHPLVGWNPNHPKCCISRDAWAVTGACLTIRRPLFHQINGFDVDYGRGTFEDCSLAMNVRKLGKRVFIDTDAQAYHYVGATMEKKQEYFPLQNNLMIFRGKWMNSGQLIWDEYRFWSGE